MTVNLKLKTTLHKDENTLEIEFDTKRETYDIKINGTSLIVTFDDTMIDQIHWSDNLTNKLRLLTLHRSVKLEDCMAIMKPAYQVTINDKNEKYLLFDMNCKNIMPYSELLKLNKAVQMQYDIITPRNESIFDIYICF